MPLPSSLPRVTFARISSRCRFACLAFGVVLASLAYEATAQVRYRVIVPEVQGQPVSSLQARGNQINESGQTLLNRSTSFAIWEENRPLRIVSARSSQLGAPVRVTASTINAKQQVVGSKTFLANGASRTLPFYWDAQNGMVDLEERLVGPATPARATTMVDLNDHGWAVGFSEEDAVPGAQAFVWHSESGATSIPAPFELGGYSATYPQAINNGGAAVGIYHRYTSSTAVYYERGFFFADGESFSLEELDSGFFTSFNHTARDINNKGQIVGESDRFGYFYDTSEQRGYTIKGFGRSSEGASATARAYAVNDHGLVAGVAEAFGADGAAEKVPLLWSRQTGALNLYDFLSHSRNAFLPANLDPNDCVIAPKSINCRGQISARVYSSSPALNYSREIILQPTLALDWQEISHVVENGVAGILYRYDKTRLPANVLPLELLNLAASFHSSDDLHTWSPLQNGEKGIRITQNDQVIELFMPFSERLFVKVSLQEASADAS